MTRGEMRTMARRLIDDTRSTRFTTDSPIDDELNLSAKFVARQVAKYQGKLNMAPASATITTDGTNKTFGLSAANYYRFFRAYRTDTTRNEDVVLIDVRDAESLAYSSGFDDAGRLVMYLTVDTAGDVLVGFPVIHLSGIAVKVEFSVRPADIATGSGNDSSTFTLVPDDYHELVVLDTAYKLGAADDTKNEMIIARRLELLNDLQQTVGQAAGMSGRIRNVMGWGRG